MVSLSIHATVETCSFLMQSLNSFELETSRVNFTNVLQAAFRFADPKSEKRHWWLDCLFALLEKAARKMLVKSTLWIVTTKSTDGLVFYFFPCQNNEIILLVIGFNLDLQYLITDCWNLISRTHISINDVTVKEIDFKWPSEQYVTFEIIQNGITIL